MSASSSIEKPTDGLSTSESSLNKEASSNIKSSLMSKLRFKNLFERIEDRPTPSIVYNWRIYSTTIMASAAAIIIGYDGGFIGGTVALDSFKNEFGLTASNPNTQEIIANIISVFHAGCCAGALFSYPCSYYFGRRIPLIGAAILITFGSAIMLASNSSMGLGPIYAGRVIAGIAVGMSTNLTVVYISEISPPAIRGALISSYEIGWRVGDLVGFWISYGVSSTLEPTKKQWFIPFAIQIIPSVLFLVGSVFMKESPRWLFQVGRHENAIANLTWFRQLPADHEYILYEVKQVEESIEAQKVNVGLGIWDPAKEVFTNKRILKRLFITCTLFLFQNFLGIQSINYYSPKIFAGLGVKGTNATLFSTGMFGVVKFICTFLYILFIVDTFGRRKAFMTSSTFCSLFFWYIGSYLKINDPTVPGNVAGPGGTVAIVFMYMWIASFILAWSGGPFVVGSEVYDQNIRSFVQAINAAISWVPIFIMSRYTSYMIKAMGYGIYFFFASLAVLSVPFVYFFLPETKGISLEDMDKLFDSSVPARKAHKIVMAQAQKESADNIHKTKANETVSISVQSSNKV